ncbi:MAG: hypothetical protein GY883_13025 [Shimia sp.]|nr:hypothetical protein [Shimia sp.]
MKPHPFNIAGGLGKVVKKRHGPTPTHAGAAALTNRFGLKQNVESLSAPLDYAVMLTLNVIGKADAKPRWRDVEPLKKGQPALPRNVTVIKAHRDIPHSTIVSGAPDLRRTSQTRALNQA